MGDKVKIDDIVTRADKDKNTIKRLSNGKLKGMIGNMTFKEICDIMPDVKIKMPDVNKEDTPKLVTPIYQRDIDEDKVAGIVSSYRMRPQHFLCKMLISIGIVEIDNNKSYYLIDGQHRVKSINKLYHEYNTNDNIMISFIWLDSDNDARLLFEELNESTSDNGVYISLDIFKRKLYEELKTELMKRYCECYSKCKSTNKPIYSVTEFVNKLQEMKYMDDYDTVDAMITQLEKIHTQYFNKLNYLEKTRVRKHAMEVFSDLEIKIITMHRNVMFMKNNNFIEHLCDPELEPYHEYKNKRLNITQEDRKQVWAKEYGNKPSGRCPIYGCEYILDRDRHYGFQCGHIVSVNNGGDTIVANMRPICGGCNTRMNTTNWNDYNDSIKRDMIWEDRMDANSDFDDDGEKVLYCDMRNCGKELSKSSYGLEEVKRLNGTIRYKMVCRKCRHNKSSKPLDLAS